MANSILKSSSNLKYRLQALVDFDFNKETLSIVKQNSSFLVGLLRLQLQSGKDSKGNPVLAKYGPFYSDATVFQKERPGVSALGRQTAFVTNYMTGSFYATIYVSLKGRSFEFDSTVPYFVDILTRSGRVIMQLNKQHTQEFTKEILIPELKRRLKSKTK